MIHILTKELDKADVGSIPDIMHKDCLVITPYNKSFLKAGANSFLVSRFYKDNELFNVEKYKELAVFNTIDLAIDYANYLNQKETNLIRT